MNAGANQPGRNQGLDILRLVAVLLVLGRHRCAAEGRSSGFLNIWATGGWTGVDLFFVLSGFLISGLLFREYLEHGRLQIGRFLIRRGLKIYPAFWVVLLYVILDRHLAGEPLPVQALAGEILFLQNYLGGLMPHTWSLAVEEHFYIGLAILFFCWQKRGHFGFIHRIPQWFLIVAVTCFLLRLATALVLPDGSIKWFHFATHVRIDSLLFGVLISYLWHFRDLEQRLAAIPSAAFVVAGVALLSPAFVFRLEFHRWITVAGDVLFYLGGGCLVIAALRLKHSRSRWLTFPAALGAASYSIYLWHIIVNRWAAELFLGGRLMDSYAWYLTAYLAGALAVGWLMNKAVEAPVLLLRDRLFPGEKRAVASRPHPAAPVTVLKG